MISCIHPSRSRPSLAAQTAKKWIDKIGLPLESFEYILSIDTDEPHHDLYRKEFDKLPKCRIITRQNRSCIDAINNAAKEAVGDIFVVVSDDFDCPEGWGLELLAHLEGKEDYIVKIDDGHQPVIITLPIMDRKYYDRFGYIYFDGYLHNFCDTDMTAVAHLLGRVVEVPMKFEHDHPVWNKNILRDELYKRNDKTFQSGKRTYIPRLLRNFDLNPDEIVGIVPPSTACLSL